MIPPGGIMCRMRKDIKSKSIRRLKIIEGQIRGIQKMVEEEKYCINIITQISATKEALTSVEDLILENHLTTHVMHQIKHDKGNRVAKEIMEVYRLKGKTR